MTNKALYQTFIFLRPQNKQIIKLVLASLRLEL